MTIYAELEEEYAFAIAHNAAITETAKENLVSGILAKNPRTTPEVSTNVRLYLHAAGTLEGLADWYAATLDSKENG